MQIFELQRILCFALNSVHITWYSFHYIFSKRMVVWRKIYCANQFLYAGYDDLQQKIINENQHTLQLFIYIFKPLSKGTAKWKLPIITFKVFCKTIVSYSMQSMHFRNFQTLFIEWNLDCFLNVVWIVQVELLWQS